MKECSPPLSHVTCHISGVMCHLSPVIYHELLVTKEIYIFVKNFFFFFSDIVVELVGGGSVILSCLVLTYSMISRVGRGKLFFGVILPFAFEFLNTLISYPYYALMGYICLVHIA